MNPDDDAVLKAFQKAKELNLCPNRIWAVGGESLPKLLPKFNLAPITRKKSDKNENFSDHDECTSDFCEYSQRDFTAVQQRHECNNEDSCKQLQDMFPREMLADAVLAESRNSTTVWSLEGNSILEPPRPYMAISHVWADGTGTGAWKAGEVNECLYEFFRDIAKRFECEGIWWDTLCIPRPKAARNKAIQKIQSSYEDARITLVHDCFLRSWKWDPETACFAILMSPWFSRGWTALELAKSRKVKVIFKGPYGPIIKDLDEEILVKYEDILANGGKSKSPREEASRIIWNLRKGIRTLNDLLAVLGPRFTSWPKDMATISAILVGVAPRERQQDTYKSILREFRHLAPGHLFHNSATMSNEFCWCPAKIFDIPSNSSKASLTISPDGDVIGKWRVFAVGPNIEKDCWWSNTHSMVKRRLQEALKYPKLCRLLVEGDKAQPVSRALLVRETQEPSRVEYIGAVHFRQDLKQKGKIEPVTISSYSRNREVSFDHPDNRIPKDRGVSTHPDRKEDGRSDSLSEPKELCDAIWRGDNERFKELSQNAKLDVRDQLGRSPLHLAAERGNKEMVQALIDLGFDLKLKCSNGQTALHRAAWGGSVGAVEQLLQAEGNQLASATDKDGNTALHTAAQAGFAPIVKILMTKIDINAKDCNGLTPLHFAAMSGHRSVVELLKNADSRAQDNKIGWTPLHCASDNGDRELVRVLIKLDGAVEIRDNHVGWTPLHIAAMSGHEAVVYDLLKHGANKTAKDNYGWIPHQFAQLNGHVEVAKLLYSADSEEGDALSANENCWTSLHCKVILDGRGNFKPFFDNGTDFYFSDKDNYKTLRKFTVNKQFGIAIRSLLKHIGGMANGIQTPLQRTAQRQHRLRNPSEQDGWRELTTMMRQHVASGWHGESTWNLFRSVGLDKESRDPGGTSLHLAVSEGHEEFTWLLLQMGANKEARDDTGWTPLHVSAFANFELGETDCVSEAATRLLVQKGADMEARDKDDETPLLLAVRYGAEAVAQLLLQHGANTEAKNTMKETPLHMAVSKNNASITRLLLQKGADTEAQDKEGKTPLHLATQFSCDTIVQLLVQKGADVAAQDHDQRSPLHSAAERGSTGATELLLHNGADKDARDKRGRAPLHSSHPAVARLLLQKGADMAAQDHDQKSPLHLAAERGSTEATELLLHNGADKDARDKKGGAPIHYSAANGQEAIVRLLIQKGANKEARDWKNQTPLHYAAAFGCTNTVRLLLEKGANQEARDRRGWTPLQLANSNGHVPAIMLLE